MKLLVKKDIRDKLAEYAYELREKATVTDSPERYMLEANEVEALIDELDTEIFRHEVRLDKQRKW